MMEGELGLAIAPAAPLIWLSLPQAKLTIIMVANTSGAAVLQRAAPTFPAL